jgi:hypothetical protein
MANQRQAAGCPSVSDVKGDMNLGATRGLPAVNPSGYPANGGGVWRGPWPPN